MLLCFRECKGETLVGGGLQNAMFDWHSSRLRAISRGAAINLSQDHDLSRMFEFLNESKNVENVIMIDTKESIDIYIITSE